MDLLGYPPYALIGGPQRAVWDAEFISYCTNRRCSRAPFLTHISTDGPSSSLSLLSLSLCPRPPSSPAAPPDATRGGPGSNAALRHVRNIWPVEHTRAKRWGLGSIVQELLLWFQPFVEHPPRILSQ